MIQLFLLFSNLISQGVIETDKLLTDSGPKAMCHIILNVTLSQTGSVFVTMNEGRQVRFLSFKKNVYL